MPSKAELERICQSIVQRRSEHEAIECTACRQGCSGGLDELWAHLEDTHGIEDLPPVDNLINVDAFLAIIPALANRQLLSSSDDVTGCFLLAAGDDDGADVAADNQALATGVPQGDADDDEAFDDGIPTQCLYCSHVGVDVEAHMAKAHGFNLRASAIFDRAVCHDEYDRMRMVNYVRRRVLENECPAGSGVTLSSSAELMAHVESTKRFLPAECPKGDEFLAPAIKGDALLMLVMADDDDFDDDADESAKYPMVPTVGDTIRMRMESEKKQPAAASAAAADDE
jgi:hypothetical protein